MDSKVHVQALPNVTLVGFAWGDEKYLRLLIKVYLLFSEYFQFAEVKFIVSETLYKCKGIPKQVQLVKAFDKFDICQYNAFCVKSLNSYFDSDFVMIFQTDGFIVNPQKWKDDFLKYDYIGAPWWYDDDFNVGNGGFSVRSKKLQQILATDPIINPAHDVNEDHYICRIMGRYLRDKHGIRFAPEKHCKIVFLRIN